MSQNPLLTMAPARNDSGSSSQLYASKERNEVESVTLEPSDDGPPVLEPFDAFTSFAPMDNSDDPPVLTPEFPDFKETRQARISLVNYQHMVTHRRSGIILRFTRCRNSKWRRQGERAMKQWKRIPLNRDHHRSSCDRAKIKPEQRKLCNGVLSWKADYSKAEKEQLQNNSLAVSESFSMDSGIDKIDGTPSSTGISIAASGDDADLRSGDSDVGTKTCLTGSPAKGSSSSLEQTGEDSDADILLLYDSGDDLGIDE